MGNVIPKLRSQHLQSRARCFSMDIKPKISFGVKATPKSAVVPVFNKKLQQASDSEGEEEEVPVNKRKVDFFEDGAAPTEENDEKHVIPIVKHVHWITKRQMAVLKAQKEAGTISEEDSARLRLLQESVGAVEAENGTDAKNVIEVSGIGAAAIGEDADYSKMAVEHFGLAILRGCGWKDGEGLGKNKVKVVVKHPQPRPKGLGLGAVPRVINDTSAKKKVDGQEAKLGVGSLIKIVGTSNNGLYGKVEAMEEENARVFVCLAISKKKVGVSQFAVQVVSKAEYDKNSKCLKCCVL